MTLPNEKPVCQHCEGDDLVFDATATWDVENQQFVHNDTFDSRPYCRDCDDEVSYTWVEVQP